MTSMWNCRCLTECVTLDRHLDKGMKIYSRTRRFRYFTIRMRWNKFNEEIILYLFYGNLFHLLFNYFWGEIFPMIPIFQSFKLVTYSMYVRLSQKFIFLMSLWFYLFWNNELNHTSMFKFINISDSKLKTRFDSLK